jgi:casein kinase II subunit beta
VLIVLKRRVSFLILLGLAIVYGKYLRREYGTCPRALCDNQSVLPTGMNDKLRVSRVKVFCPKCEEIYVP